MVQVKATTTDTSKDSKDNEYSYAFSLFTICDKRGRNCITIDDFTINDNKVYGLFEIKNKEIYLNN